MVAFQLGGSDAPSEKRDYFLSQESVQKAFLHIHTCSPYLSRLLERHPDLVNAIAEQGYEQVFCDILNTIWSHPYGCSREQFMAHLRIKKQHVALLVALADITGTWTLETVTYHLSQFADKVIQHTVCFLLEQAAKKGEMALPDMANPEEGSGLVVLAMGKMGAFELNYSSDIDIILFFDKESAPYEGRRSAQQFFNTLCQQCIQTLQERSPEGYVFRVDVRLRPDPGSMPLAVSIAAAKEYYETVGQNWERAAFIKARCVAGDRAKGAELLEYLRPFVWRKYLDVAALEDIRSIKRQIESSQRHLDDDLYGYNIKLGHGGIREIEFYVQTQQLIWGGRQEELQTPSTCDALKALYERQHISLEAMEELLSIYQYWRILEHRLQMVEDAQTHTIPESEEAFESIATFMGYDQVSLLSQDIREKLECVMSHYASLFPTSSSLGIRHRNLVFTGIENDQETIRTLENMGFVDGNMISDRIRGWHHGRYRATRSRQAREHLTELMPDILKAFSESTHPDTAFMKFDDLLSKIPAAIQLFSFIHLRRELLPFFADILGNYDYLASILIHRPSLLDTILSNTSDYLDEVNKSPSLMTTDMTTDQGIFADQSDTTEYDAVPLDELSTLLEEATHYEEVLDMARRWTYQQKFLTGIHYIRGDISPGKVRDNLSSIAEGVLQLLYPYVYEEFCQKHGVVEGGKFAIIALGKLGSRELTFNSDIDLIMVYDCPDQSTSSIGGESLLTSSQYYTRLSRHYIASFMTLTRQGRLYEIDMRLRPSGHDGPLCTNLNTLYEYYHSETAKTWEYMALTRARVVVGDPSFVRKIERVLASNLILECDIGELRRDILALRRKVDESYGTTNPWHVKHVRGGIMDAEFIAQFLQLAYGAQYPDLLSTNSLDVFSHASACGVISGDIAIQLSAALSFLLDVQTALRIAYQQRDTDSARKLLQRLYHTESQEDVDLQLEKATHTVHHYMDVIIGIA